MDIKDAVASREVFDAWTLDRLTRLIDDPQRRAQIIERQYPRSTSQAVDELCFRGFDATEAHAERFAARNGVETFGGVLAWYKSDIDALVDFLEGANKLNYAARHRLMYGVGWEADHE